MFGAIIAALAYPNDSLATVYYLGPTNLTSGNILDLLTNSVVVNGPLSGDPGSEIDYTPYNSSFTANQDTNSVFAGSFVDEYPAAASLGYTFSLIKTGSGALILSGQNAIDGPVAVNAGTLQIGNGGTGEALASQSISVSSGAVLAFNQSDTVTVSPTAGISGRGALVKFNSGTLVLGSTNNTYTGGTTLSAGVLNFIAGALPFASNSIAFNGGALQWATGNTQDVSAGFAPIASGQTAYLDTNGNNVTFAAGLSGNGGLTKLGGGSLVLLGNNSLGGSAVVNGGTLTVNGSLNVNGGAVQSGAFLTGRGSISCFEESRPGARSPQETTAPA